MGDMTQATVPKSDQINSDELQGRTMTITVTDVTIKGGQEQPVSISFVGSEKVYRPCKSMCRVLANGWGLDSKAYIGRSMTLYCDPTVKFGPLAVGGIRISHMTHIEGPMVMALTAAKGVKKSYKVQPLVMGQHQQQEFTIGQARADMDAAGDLDALKAAWSRKIMAPHRDALAEHLEARKLELSGEGTSDAQRGEQSPEEAERITEEVLAAAGGNG